MVLRHQFREIADIVRHPQTRAELLHQLDSRRTMAVVTRPERLRRQPFAEVMAQGGETYVDIRRQHRGHRDGHQGVQAGVDFPMPFRRGRHAVQGVNLREQHLEGLTVAQRLEKDLRVASS